MASTILRTTSRIRHCALYESGFVNPAETIGGAERVIINLVRSLRSADPTLDLRLIAGANGAAAGIAVSRAVAKDCLDALPSIDVAAVYNVIDTERFSPHDRTGRTWLAALSLSQPPACLVATYARWKGHDVFLRAAARTLTMYPAIGIHFYIVRKAA